MSDSRTLKVARPRNDDRLTVTGAAQRNSGCRHIARCCNKLDLGADSVCGGRDRSRAGGCSALRSRTRDSLLTVLLYYEVAAGRSGETCRVSQVGAPAFADTRARWSRAWVAGFGKVRRGRTPEFTGRR